MNTNHNLFFRDRNIDPTTVQRMIDPVLQSVDDGELYLEHLSQEALQFEDGVLKHSSFHQHGGFGLRSIVGERSAYAHSSNWNEEELAQAIKVVEAVKNGYDGNVALAAPPQATNRARYHPADPISEMAFATKIALLQEIDGYLRKKDPLVKQVSVTIAGQHQAIEILREGGFQIGDVRPLVRLSISVVVEKNGRMERGSYGMGGRSAYDEFITPAKWREAAEEALRQAKVNLEARPAPAGQMPVVLGPGWPGVLLHEAIGHGLEGDFNRKKTSAFSDRIGERVAAAGITIVDDGTINDRRGSITIDDEGSPSAYNILVEDGILKQYMQDRMNARLMGVPATGNGRRESYAYQPMPRMTNTYMLAGNHTPEEIIASVDNGIYAVNFGGGQVDITSGKFVFSASEAYRIENGKVTYPIKGATLIGHGPDVLTKVSMIGNDMALDPGIGTCGKDGQQIPVGVGQPTLKVDELTVGGTEHA